MFRYYHYNLLTRNNNRYTYFISNLGCHKERQHSNYKLMKEICKNFSVCSIREHNNSARFLQAYLFNCQRQMYNHYNYGLFPTEHIF